MIGIISDTHEQIEAICAAVKVFKDKKMDLVVHCGDIICPAMLKYFEGLNMKFVFGNCDGERTGLNKEAYKLGFEEITETKDFEYKDKKFFVCHGMNHDVLGEAVKSGKYDYVLTGHTHNQLELNKNHTKIINPGTLLGEDKSIAILDEENNDVVFVNIEL